MSKKNKVAYILIPVLEEVSSRTLPNGSEEVEEEGDLAIFKVDEDDYDDTVERLTTMCQRGKFNEFIIIHEELLEDAVPITDLYVASLKEDLELE